MEKNISKKDIILLNGSDESKVDVILQELSTYFKDHHMISRIHLKRNRITLTSLIRKHVRRVAPKLLISADKNCRSKAVFSVLCTRTAEIPTEDMLKHKQKQYNLIINFDDTFIEKKGDEPKILTIDEAVTRIVVAWGRWSMNTVIL